MKNKGFIFFLIAILLCNSFVLLGTPPVTKKETAYSELKKLLGETVIICTDTNSKKYYISSFDRLDEEQKQHLEDLDNIKKNTSNTDNNDSTITEFYVTLNLRSLSGKIFENDIISEEFFTNFKSSRAPPTLS